MFLVDFFRAVYKVVEVFFLYSPSRFIYSTVIFAVALFFFDTPFCAEAKGSHPSVGDFVGALLLHVRRPMAKLGYLILEGGKHAKEHYHVR